MTGPHLFSGDAEEPIACFRTKVETPLHGCDSYAYTLLAFGYMNLLIESAGDKQIYQHFVEG
uniref:Uncharacterized protein n=1 Tax=Nelumbo nucifera TaxID=4432 RepID=A0A822XU61_NELNU|nr:TPA_asm: hypothetical protein HUJ06_023899 [Nelumbo nucifera]